MSKKAFYTTCGGIVLIAVTLACSLLNSSSPSPSTPELPNYGVFLIQGESFVELKQYAGQPDENSILPEIETTSSTPVFLVWYPQINLQYFLLVSLDQPGLGIPYKTTPKNEESQMLEIKPSNPLADGIYCLYQGDPLGNPYSLPFWCFQAGNNLSSNIPPQSTPTEFSNSSNSTPQTALDQEAISFRDQALQVVRGFTTVEYSSRLKESTIPNTVLWEGISTATLNTSHFVAFDKDYNLYQELISVDNTFCVRGGSGAWTCHQQAHYSLILGIINILEGKPLYPFNKQVTAFGSKIDSYNGIECRTFFVETLNAVSKATVTATEREEVCFELEGYSPIYHLSNSTFAENGAVYLIEIFEDYDFKFNVPVEEIVLPQQ